MLDGLAQFVPLRCCVGGSQDAAVVGLRCRVHEGEAPACVCGLGEVIVGY